jgi:2-dehydro-3-deoxygluconokinase
MLFGDLDADACLARLKNFGIGEIVVKRGALGCLIDTDGKTFDMPPRQTLQPVDTTAAGDSFNAGYLAARINGAMPREAAAAGHRLAGAVIMAPGAVIPKDAMPPNIFEAGES